jgi:membrane protein required for colicin V production
MISPSWLGEVVGYGAVFLVVVIPLSFMSYRFSEGVKKSQVGALDRALGGAFGVVRGLAIIGIAYLIFSAIVPIPSQPGWITRARLLPLIQGSAEVVASLVPDQHMDRGGAVREKPHGKLVIHQKAAKPAPAPAAKPAAKKHLKKTYGAKDRHALDRLIETTGSDGSGKP